MIESVLTQCTTPKHRIKALARYFHARAETVSKVLSYLPEFLATFSIDNPDMYINYDYDTWHYWVHTRLWKFIEDKEIDKELNVQAPFPLSNGYTTIFHLYFSYAIYYAYSVLGGNAQFMTVCDDSEGSAIYRLTKLTSSGDQVGEGERGLTPEEALDEIKSSLHSLTAFEAACTAQLEGSKADKVTIFNDTIQQLFANPYAEVSNTATYLRQNLLNETSDDNFLNKLTTVIGVKELVEQEENMEQTDIYNTCGTGPASAFGLGLTGAFGVVGAAFVMPLKLGWEVIKGAAGLVSSLFSKYVLTPFRQAVIDPYDIEDLDPDGKERSHEIDGWAIPLTDKLKKYSEKSGNDVYFDVINWTESNDSMLRKYFPDYDGESSDMDNFLEYFRTKWVDKSYKFDTYFGSVQVKFHNVPAIIERSGGGRGLSFKPEDVTVVVKPKSLDQSKYSGSIYQALYNDPNTQWFNSDDISNQSEEYFRDVGPTVLSNSNDSFFSEFWSTHPPIYADCSYSEKELWSGFNTSLWWLSAIFRSSYESFYKYVSMIDPGQKSTIFTLTARPRRPMLLYPTNNVNGYNAIIQHFENNSSNQKITNYHFSSVASGLFTTFRQGGFNIIKTDMGYVNDETYTPQLTDLFDSMEVQRETPIVDEIMLGSFIGLKGSPDGFTDLVKVNISGILPLYDFTEDIIGCLFHHALDNYNHPLNFEFLPFVEGELDNAPSFRIKTTAENDSVAKNLGKVLATLVIVAVLAVVATFAVKKIAKKLFYSTKGKLMVLDQKMYNGEKLTKQEMRQYSRLTRRNNFFGKLSGQLQGSQDESVNTSELEKTIADSNELITGLIN